MTRTAGPDRAAGPDRTVGPDRSAGPDRAADPDRTALDELDHAVQLVNRARTGRELFGTDQPHRRYLRLAAILHPDRTGTLDETRRHAATSAFTELTRRWHDHRHGDRDRRTATVSMVNGYPLGEPAYAGDLADLYDVGDARLVKLPREAANNDLMLREQSALRRIADHGDPRYLPYVPRLVDAFRHRDPDTGVERRVSVLAAVPGLVSLAEVARRRPGGVDPRDAAWMWRRLLVALGLAHRAGVVHGAVLPEHVLIEPAAHGLVLVDWCYSVTTDAATPGGAAPPSTAHPGTAPPSTTRRSTARRSTAPPSTGTGDTVPAIVPAYRDWYPAEVHRRRPPGPGTDIAMAARCLAELMGPRMPDRLARFVRGCTAGDLAHRPDDAWRLLGELDAVLEDLYGPRTFRPFHL